MIVNSEGAGCPHNVVVRPSMLALAVLAVAEQAPVSGKSFSEKIEVLTQGWHISPGLIYPLLGKMEREGLLKCEHAAPREAVRGRRELVYSLTAKGTAFLGKARSRGQEHINQIMSRMMPLAAFVCFGEDDAEFLELMKKVRGALNEKIWRAAKSGRKKRLGQLRKLANAIEKA